MPHDSAEPEACLGVRFPGAAWKTYRSADGIITTAAPGAVGGRRNFLASRPVFVGSSCVLASVMTRTLLVVDDNKSVRESLRFLLLRRGYAVLVAENGPDALSLAAQHAVDGALVDVNMPGMSGIEVCTELRRRAAEASRAVPVWLMTGARTPDLAKAAQVAGALALLGKPFNFADLFRRFDEQLGGPPEPPRPPPDALDAL